LDNHETVPAENRPPLVIIGGPTATGKTGFGVTLARALGAEIISADSMQVYRGFDIGTAKPTAEEMGGVRHHLIDVAAPDEPYDASRFVAEADRAVANIAARGTKAVVGGGTGLYIRALLHGLHPAPPPSEEIRSRIQARAAQTGWPALHARLREIDPISADRLHPNDGVRILRALEVFEQSGTPISEWQSNHGFAEQRYRALLIGLERPRETLYRRINTRVDQMMSAGFLPEVTDLLAQGLSPSLKPMQALGYRRLVAHRQGSLSLAEAVEKTKTDTRRFAKRQLTWFKGEPALIWLPSDPATLMENAEKFWREAGL
jgi:tRNA dimethylallyltransferase